MIQVALLLVFIAGVLALVGFIMLDPRLEEHEKLIFINGKDIKLKVSYLTYADICDLAGKSIARNPSVMVLVHGCETHLLSHGDSMEVTEGMRIDCGYTDNA